MHLLGSISIADMSPWNSIQRVSVCTFWAPFQLLTCPPSSGWAPPGLYFNCWYAPIKFHPASEWLCTSWSPFQLLIYVLWNSIQRVSGCAPPGFHFNCWYSSIKSHSACEWLCTFWAPLLIYLYEISFSKLVAVHLLGSISIADMFSWNSIPFHPGSEWLYISWVPFESLIYHHYILFSLYLSFHLLPLPHSINGILQVKDVKGLVDIQFNVIPDAILFSSLHSYISNYIGTFFVFFYWWPILHFLLYLPLLNTIYSHSHLSWTFLLDCPARFQSQWWLYHGLEKLSQDPACTGWSRIG